MLSKMFGKRARFNADDPDQRRAAIEELDAADCERLQDELAELAATDPEAAVRCAAIVRLTSSAVLESMLHDGEQLVVQAAANRMAELATEEPRLLEVPVVRDARIREASDPEAVSALIDAIGSPAEVLNLAIDAKSPKVRLSLARRLKTTDALAELERRTRSRDKTVNRYARTHLDDVRHNESLYAKARRRADQLLETLEGAAEKAPLTASRLGTLTHSWTTNLERLDELAAALREAGVEVAAHDDLGPRYDAALARAEQVRPDATAQPPRGDDFAALLEELKSFEADVRNGKVDLLDELEAIHARYADLGARWSSHSDHEAPPEKLAEPYHAIVHGFAELFAAVERLADCRGELRQRLGELPDDTATAVKEPALLWRSQRRGVRASARLAQIVAGIDWPDELPRPRLLDDVADRQRAFAEFAAHCDDRSRALEAKADGLITDLDARISDGNLDAALKCDQDLRTVLKELPDEPARRMRQRAHPLESRLQELKDWRSFATSPKRDALVEEMRALIDTDLEPPARAEKIKDVRARWNALGPATNRQDRKSYEQFNQAAEEAFAPCRTFYAEQAERREFNLEQRRAICDALAQFLAGADWSHVDWKGAEQILRTARDEWRQFHPVDRVPGRKLRTQFEKLTGELHGHIKAEWDRNIALKETLIEEATAIAEADRPMREATEAIKALQQRWREVGIMPRRVDQRLWKAFRAACDAVFERRDQQRTARRESLDEVASAAEALCDEFQSHIDTSAADAVNEHVLRDYRRRFHELGELPRAKASALQRRFDELERAYRALLRDAAQHELLATLARWRAADETLAALEAGGAGAPSPAVPTAAELGIDATPGIERRLEKIATGSPPDAAALDGRRRLAIEAEVAAGLDSPEADRQQRLELQVERLNRGMSGPREDQDPLQLAATWCGLSSPGADDALRERFFIALRRLAE